MNEDEKQRHTLVSVTKAFINMLLMSNGAEIDLVSAETALGASKRRLYDVTNVLAGVGLIERCGKAKVKWIGTASMDEYSGDTPKLCHDYQELEKVSQNVDNFLSDLTQSELFSDYAWVSPKDILSIIPDNDVRVYALRGPSSMTIQVSDMDGDVPFHLICKAPEGEIDLIPIS